MIVRALRKFLSFVNKPSYVTNSHTAYGAKAFVPGNVDILIAGTSCVDYSNIKNEKKDIDQVGESGRTFHGMLNWVRKTSSFSGDLRKCVQRPLASRRQEI
jgi:hypothetical protein